MRLLSALAMGTLDYLKRPQTLGALLNTLVRPRIQRERAPKWRVFDPIKLRRFHVRQEQLPTSFGIDKPVMGRLVIQVHQAKRAGRHYDWRIHGVVDGESISFAVPNRDGRKAIMPGRGERWLAVLQPNHDALYSDFEGVIPDGNLGAGAVSKALDVPCEIFKAGPDKIQLMAFTPDGPLELTLVHTKEAQYVLQQTSIQPVARVPKPIFRSTNKAWQTEGVQELKIDGSMTQAYVRSKSGRVRLFSHRESLRTGELIEYRAKFPQLDYGADHTLRETVLLGELYHPKMSAAQLGGLLNTKDVLTARKNGSTKCRYAVWDAKVIDGQDVSGLAYIERRQLVEDLVKAKRLPPGFEVVPRAPKGMTNDEAFAWAQAHRIPNDGLVIKADDSRYVEGLAWDWHKLKPVADVSLPVVSVLPGEGKYSDTMGSLVVRTPDDKLIRVGSGYSDAQRDWFWQNRENVVGEAIDVGFHDRYGQEWTGPRYIKPASDSDLNLRMMADTAGDPAMKYRFINHKR